MLLAETFCNINLCFIIFKLLGNEGFSDKLSRGKWLKTGQSGKTGF